MVWGAIGLLRPIRGNQLRADRECCMPALFCLWPSRIAHFEKNQVGLFSCPRQYWVAFIIKYTLSGRCHSALPAAGGNVAIAAAPPWLLLSLLHAAACRRHPGGAAAAPPPPPPPPRLQHQHRPPPPRRILALATNSSWLFSTRRPMPLPNQLLAAGPSRTVLAHGSAHYSDRRPLLTNKFKYKDNPNYHRYYKNILRVCKNKYCRILRVHVAVIANCSRDDAKTAQKRRPAERTHVHSARPHARHSLPTRALPLVALRIGQPSGASIVAPTSVARRDWAGSRVHSERIAIG